MNILNNIIEVNGDLGFSVQGTANCKALGFARNIAQAKTLASVTPTVDSRADWEDEQTGKAVAIVHSKQNGHSEQRDPDLEIAKWCYVIRMLGLEQPSLEGSVKFLEENAGPKVSRKDFDDLVEEVMDEFTGKDKEAKARAFVQKELDAEKIRDQESWKLLGAEALRIVQSEIELQIEGNDRGLEGCANPGLPEELEEVADRHAHNTVDRIRARHGLLRTAGRVKLLKQCYMS
tara:strand:+ start:171 stop:869 length:699 start_codon:yes stop_codon:yes gene_type:complete